MQLLNDEGVITSSTPKCPGVERCGTMEKPTETCFTYHPRQVKPEETLPTVLRRNYLVVTRPDEKKKGGPRCLAIHPRKGIASVHRGIFAKPASSQFRPRRDSRVGSVHQIPMLKSKEDRTTVRSAPCSAHGPGPLKSNFLASIRSATPPGSRRHVLHVDER